MKSRFSAKAHKLLMPPARPGGQMTAQVLAVKADFACSGSTPPAFGAIGPGQEDYQ
jgi:hypothetical protein